MQGKGRMAYCVYPFRLAEKQMGRLSVTIEIAVSHLCLSLLKTDMYSLESRSPVRDPNSVLWNMSSCPSSLARDKIFLNT
jgi:hypothetical protein